MGAVGLNGATIEVDDHTQRTRVANAGWFRWAPIVGASVLVHVGSAFAMGRLGPERLRPAHPPVALRRVRSAATLAAILATVETGVSGQRIVHAGDVPVASAVTPIAATPPVVASAQRRLRVAQWVVPACTAVLWVLDAVQDRRRSLPTPVR
jgi:hypothetical protein